MKYLAALLIAFCFLTPEADAGYVISFQNGRPSFHYIPDYVAPPCPHVNPYAPQPYYPTYRPTPRPTPYYYPRIDRTVPYHYDLRRPKPRSPRHRGCN